MFFLFAGEKFYPNGGMNDYRGAYPTLEEAQKAAAELCDDWYQIAVASRRAFTGLVVVAEALRG
jgi:hypothetical protein